MKRHLRIALVGLDTMHAVEFARLLQDPGASEAEKVSGARISSCFRFKTPFQSEEGMDERQRRLESLGIRVATNLDEALHGCDAILLTIDDPSFHLEYFLKCLASGKPIYVDKPFSDSLAHSKEMIDAAASAHVRFFTASALRYDKNIASLAKSFKGCQGAYVYGAFGKAPSGSSIVWYAVHSFEILRLFMGPGAASVVSIRDGEGMLCRFRYQDGRNGIVKLARNSWNYGGTLHLADGEQETFRYSQPISFYTGLLEECISFFHGETEAVPHEESLEIMAMLEAAELSSKIEREVHVSLE